MYVVCVFLYYMYMCCVWYVGVLYRAIAQLAQASIVQYDQDNDGITANAEAHIMSKHMIALPTMSVLMNLSPTACTADKVLYLSLSLCLSVSLHISYLL